MPIILESGGRAAGRWTRLRPRRYSASTRPFPAFRWDYFMDFFGVDKEGTTAIATSYSYSYSRRHA